MANTASFDRKKMAECLKILAENPGRIKAQDKLYSERLAEIKAREASGNWSPNTIKREREEAKAEHDRVAHALANAMRPALEYVRQNNDFTALPIDLDNSKLQRAVNMIGLMGKNLSFSDQAGLIDQFRGDPASLRVLEAAFSKNGQEWAAKTAKEMQKPISNQALDELSVVLAFHEYHERKGEFSFPAEKMVWTHPAFAQHAQKLGLDLDEVADPYSLALDLTLARLQEEEFATAENPDPAHAAQERARIAAQKYKLSNAKQEIRKATETGADPAAIFNKALTTAERSSPVEQDAAATPKRNSELSVDTFVEFVD